MKVMCSVFDSKAQLFSAPFVSHSRITAVRDFEGAVRDAGSGINKFPQDYQLYLLGSWDEESGQIDQREVPELLVRGDSFKE